MNIQLNGDGYTNQWVKDVLLDIGMCNSQLDKIRAIYAQGSISRKQMVELIGEVERTRDNVLVAVIGLASDITTRRLGFHHSALTVEVR